MKLEYHRLIRVTPRKYVFDVTSIDQRLSPWARNSVKVEITFHLECKLRFPCGQLTVKRLSRDV